MCQQGKTKQPSWARYLGIPRGKGLCTALQVRGGMKGLKTRAKASKEGQEDTGCENAILVKNEGTGGRRIEETKEWATR